jgi:hypothetical protein
MATYESRKYNIPGADITNISATQIADGSVSNAEFQAVDTTTSLTSQFTSKLPKAGGTMTGGIVFPDDSGPAPAKVSFGAGDDLRIFSDGSTGFLKGNDVRVVNSSDVEMIKAASGGAVDLRHNGTTRVSTSGSGATINGTLSATTVSAPTGSFTNVSGNGSGLTSLNASNISSGTLASDRIGGNVITGTGSAGYYAQRAWVRFNSNSSNSVYGSQNVSSITDHAVGKYTVNFSTAMPNANYGVIVTPSSQQNYFAVDINGWIDSSGSPSGPANATAPTTNGVRVAIFTDYSLQWRDTDNVVVSVFGV